MSSLKKIVFPSRKIEVIGLSHYFFSVSFKLITTSFKSIVFDFYSLLCKLCTFLQTNSHFLETFAIIVHKKNFHYTIPCLNSIIIEIISCSAQSTTVIVIQ